MFEQWLGGTASSEREVGVDGRQLDLVVEHPMGRFVVEVQRSDDVALLERANEQLQAYTRVAKAVPVVAVPFMGPKAREYARRVGLSWLDLSGNADIRAPGVRILIEGNPNRFASPGRPSTAFADKGSRVARHMLFEPERWWRQRALVDATGLSSGYVSKVVARMTEDALVEERAEDGSVRPRSAMLLLDAWAQAYDFSRHEVARFHAVGRTGADTTRGVAERLAEHSLEWAATGLSSAWLWSGFADHRLATFFVSERAFDPAALGLRAVEEGENVWIVTPRDPGVFHGASDVKGVRCVHPVQTYLDLLGHPERAADAAAELRDRRFGWGDP